MRQPGRASLWLAALSCLCLGFGPPVLTEGDAGGARLAPQEVSALLALQSPPEPRAGAALLADETTGQVLLEKHARDRRAVASTTKIMTALLVLERCSLDEVVVVSQEAALTGGNRVGLAPGEQVTVLDLLYGLLLNSGNDAATALAEHVAGSVAGFVTLMNVRAQELGLADTHFVNPHGLDAPEHYSTAYDLWLLSREALKNGTFRQIVGTPDHSIGGRHYVNLNQMLTTYPGADGVKTGTTDLAGECLVVSATRQGHRLIAVVLNSANRYEDAKSLLDYGFEAYGWLRVRMQGRALNQVKAKERTCRLTLVPQPDLLLPRWQLPGVQMFRHVVGLSGEEGVAGEFHLNQDGRVLLRAPLLFRCQPAPG